MPARGGLLIDEIVRYGTVRMPAITLRAEAAAVIAAHVNHLDTDGRRLVTRNGYTRARQTPTSAEAKEAAAPPTPLSSAALCCRYRSDGSGQVT